MGARPVASLDSIRFGPLEQGLHRRLLQGVVEGIGFYGNCVGVPTVGGETGFHACYAGNILVNAMSVGVVETDLSRVAVDCRRLDSSWRTGGWAMSVQGFHTIVLQVSDLSCSIKFYEAALGLELVRQSDRSAQQQTLNARSR